MQFVFGAGDGKYARTLPGDERVVFYIGDEPVVEGLGGFRLRTPQDVAAAVNEIFGDPIKAFALAESDIHLDHPCGVPDHYRKVVANEFIGHSTLMCRFWGNSTIDGLHGAYNLCKNAEFLVDAPPLVDVPKLDCPAIAVGAGPSLAKVIDKLPALRDKCLIVACDTVAAKLKKAGCDPHVVTPLERINVTSKKLADYKGNAWFCGLPVVPPAAVRQFKRHLSVCHDDTLYDWAGICHDEDPKKDRKITTGSTSGTMSVYVADQLVSGPVYLVGHDLCVEDVSYFDDDVESARQEHEVQRQVRGNDGEMHGTTEAWARARDEIDACAAYRRVINVSTSLDTGVRFQYAEDGRLPAPGSLPTIKPRLKTKKRANDWQTLKARGKKLYKDWTRIVDDARLASSLQSMDISRVCSEKNVPLFAYILRPLFAQISVERRLGRPEDQLVSIWKQRISNMGREITGVIKQMCDSFGDKV
jgi:hypothetical protein